MHYQDLEQKLNSDDNQRLKLRNMTRYNPNIELVNDIVYTKSGLNMSMRSEDIKKNNNKFWRQSRGVTILRICRKLLLYNPNIDIVNDDVDTKFCLKLSICSQDIEQKTFSDLNSRAVALLQLCKK